MACIVNQSASEEHYNTKKDLPQKIPWSPPEDGCIKINVDGARSHRSRSTAIASIVRDSRLSYKDFN